MELNAVAGQRTLLQSQSVDFLAQASVPRHAFGTREAAEDYIKRSLLDMQNGYPRGENGSMATAFYDPSSQLYFVYGPDNFRNYPQTGSIPGYEPAMNGHGDRAFSELGNDARYVTGGYMNNGFFHTLTPGPDGYIQQGRPER